MSTKIGLKFKGGKYVRVVKFPPLGLSLCAGDVQNAEREAPSVDIYERKIAEITQLAFRFNSSHFLKVDEVNKSLTVTECKPNCVIEDITHGCWFVKEDVGSAYYCLKSVVNINMQYVKIEPRPGNKKKFIFCLGASKEECAHVTDVTYG